MLRSLLTVLGLFAWSSSGQQKTILDHAYEQGSWRLEVHRDLFRGDTQCRLTDDYGHFPEVIARRRVLTLKIRNRVDGSAAWFSINGAPAKPWHDVEADLIARGAMAQAEALDNATNGELSLPYPIIEGAHTIAVQVKDGGHIHMYRLDGLWSMIASAQRLGCDFENGPPFER